MNQQLQDRITELVRNGDAPSLIWLVEGQLRITDLAYARIAELEAANAALREFVAANDRMLAAVFEQPDWWNVHPDIWEIDALSHNAIAARQRLATDHGIPLPGQEGE